MIIMKNLIILKNVSKPEKKIQSLNITVDDATVDPLFTSMILKEVAWG